MGGELVGTNDRVSFVGNPSSSAWISYLILEVKEHVCLRQKREWIVHLSFTHSCKKDIRHTQPF